MKFKYLFIIILLLCTIISCKKDEEPTLVLEDRLKNIQDFSVTRIFPSPPEVQFSEIYKIMVTQPVDHNNPSGPTFQQAVYLKHNSESDPVILHTEGYRSSVSRKSELNSLFPSNYIGIEHRYYGESTPTNKDWQYLTIEQAAADHHKIVESLKAVYSGKWLSTGGSKGGKAALFHKRFYPEDVDATVAIVAPITLDLPDLRLDAFLNTHGTVDCRDRIKNFQRMVLTKREAMLAKIESYSTQNGYTFSVGDEAILEYSAIDYQYSFWQYHNIDCALIPDETSTDQEIFDHLLEVSPLLFYEDRLIANLEPYFYQAFTETGMYYPIEDHLSGLLITLSSPRFLSLGPANVDMVYDNSLMLSVSAWLKSSGNNIIYIYGGNDPWTAAAVNPNEQVTNSIQIIQPGVNHHFTLDELDERDRIYALIEEWLGVEI